MRSLLALLLLSVLVGFRCAADPRPVALVAPDRTGHFFDRPFPSDELRAETGFVDLSAFAETGTFGQLFLDGWLAQVGASVRGFSSVGAVYLRFDRDPELAEHYSGAPSDPVRLFGLDSGHRVAVRTRWIESSLGDPFLPDRTLLLLPDERTPLRSGERYAAWVSKDVAARAPGWSPPVALPAPLRARAAVATVFTVQDLRAQMRSLRDATDRALAEAPSLLEPTPGLRRVTRLAYGPGATPSGDAATAERVTFEDGTEAVTFLRAGAPESEVDLESGPLRVYEATIRTLAFQEAAGRPYQSPGLGILFDTERTDGWIPFDAAGATLREPTPEPLRIVLQVPTDLPVRAVLIWGHGSGGDAYEAIQRTDPANRIDEIRTRLAARGVAILSSDQPLFGRRFPLIDAGYDPSLAVVNVPNLPAFRANVRQGGVDQRVLWHFVREVLPELPEIANAVPGFERRVGIFGHSIGAQIAGVAAPLHDPSLGGVLLNGTGGFVSHSVLAGDLFSLEGSVAGLIFQIAGIPAPPDPTAPTILGALLGVPEAAWSRIDRFHPLTIPFQLVIDGADPLAVAAEHPIPTVVHLGDGDSFVPPDGGAWLGEAPREGEFVPCTPLADYNGHFCLFREESGFETFERFADGL